MNLNIKGFEDLYPKYGLHPVQNGCEIRTFQAWIALRCG